ncbi:TetR/AcrR family transcriptional regulator [Streptomyces sp. NPDC005648]|uniref:TetR/AcrR family transcriptional regulator n=1 Tax=Streptomyces sp. NPDC005648 TaxID=3157044 RepID=UPI0033B8D6AB
MPVATPSTKLQIVLAAERLFAQHGLDGVSLRQIGAAAGNANNSAVQYHFGSRDRLVEAVFDHRLPQLRELYTAQFNQRNPQDLRGLVECQAFAVLHQGEQPGSHYLRFISMLQQYGKRDVFSRHPEEVFERHRNLHAQLAASLPDVPEQLLAQRLSRAMILIVQTVANRETAQASNRDVLPFALEGADLVDSVLGLLQAPVSNETRAAFMRASEKELNKPYFL